MKAKILFTSLSMVAGLCAAQGRQLPQDVDLKAAYCFGIIKPFLANISTLEGASEMIAARKDDLGRLNRYMQPRIGLIAAEPMISAVESGQLDYRKLVENYEKCVARGDVPQKCFTESPLQAKLDACYGAPFLPY